MFKCILICGAFPFRGMLGSYHASRMAPPVTTSHVIREDAMSSAVREVVRGALGTAEDKERNLQEVLSMVTYSPATGVVYVDGTACGVIVSVETDHKMSLRSA